MKFHPLMTFTIYSSVHLKLCTFDNGEMTPSKRHVFSSIFALFFAIKSFSKSVLIKYSVIVIVIEDSKRSEFEKWRLFLKYFFRA